MTLKRWFGLVAIIVLAGCATPPEKPRTSSKLECDGGRKCEVAVSVNCSIAGCQLSVEHDLVVVLEKKQVDIVWLLPQDSEYAFAQRGIEFKESRDFDCKADGPRRFVCRDRHSKFGAWKYAISVTGPKTVPPLDPWVIND